MNYVGLIIHGLSAMSVFSEVVGARMLIATSTLVLLTLVGLVVVVAVRFLTDLAIPGWATYTFGLLLVVLLQAIMFAISFSFTILNGRRGAGFIPIRDYVHFVDHVDVLASKGND